jgi:hypothetical protein
MVRAVLFLICAASAWANTCTPLSVTLSGPLNLTYTNGVTDLDSTSVKISWTTDAGTTGNPATASQILYATNAEWGGTSARSSYPHTQSIQGESLNVTSNSIIIGGVISNLVPSTGYHALVQAQQASAWCTATDITFTTAAAYTFTSPTAPEQPNLTMPAMTGTHWLYGGPSGGGYTVCGDSGTATQRWQNCLSGASPGSGTGAQLGDDISAPPATYQIVPPLYFPNSPLWKQMTCVTVGSTCMPNGGVVPPQNGTAVIMYQPPAPINPGVTYAVINSSYPSAGTFQLARCTPYGFMACTGNDGVAISFQNTGGTFGDGNDFYTPYPYPQNQIIVIKPTTYGTSALPPTGVRLGLDSVSQYQPNMITLENMDPYPQAAGQLDPGGLIVWGTNINGPFLSSGWWFQDVAFTTDPTVATTYGNGMDPMGWRVPLSIGGNVADTAFYFDQVCFCFSLPPSRSGEIGFAANSSAIMHSSQQGLDWWGGHLYAPYGTAITNTSTTITFPAVTQSHVIAGGSSGVGQKSQCTNSGGTWQVTGGGSTSQASVWMTPPSGGSCNWVVQAQPGVTVSTTGQVTAITGVSAPTVTQVGTPGSTSYSYTIAAADGNGNEITAANALFTPSTTTTTGNATLSSTNKNRITWSAYAGATCYNIYSATRSSGIYGPGLPIGQVCSPSALTFDDTGTGVTGDGTYGFPTYSYAGPSGSLTNKPASVFAIGTFSMTSGAITSTNLGGPYGASQQNAFGQGGPAVGYNYNGVGVIAMLDNQISSGPISGIFFSDDDDDGTSPCNITGTACTHQHLQGDLVEAQSTIGMNACYFADANCWNGGNYYGRNATEGKQLNRAWQWGNQYGPVWGQVGLGECALHETYNGQSFPTLSTISYTSSNDWRYEYNTCTGTGAQIISGFNNTSQSGAPIKNWLVRNNLFLNNNAYSSIPHNQSFGYPTKWFNEDVGDTNCPEGYLTNWAGGGQNIVLDHNTVWGQGGCLSVALGIGANIQAGTVYTNNIFNILADPGLTSYQGSLYLPYNTTDPCWGDFGVTLWNCQNSSTWASNVLLFTYQNSNPSSPSEWTSAQISTWQGSSFNFPSSLIPAGNTLAARLANTNFFSACTLSSSASCVNNLRLQSVSPFISGAHASTDALDIGVSVDQLEAHQGKVSNVRALSLTSTGVTVAWYAADTTACGLDWTSNAWASWTRVAGSAGSRVQSITLSSLPIHGAIQARINCPVSQPVIAVQLP